MAFWTYILHCRGGAFYVGHTDDLNRRISQHQTGMVAGFTADHLPVRLVWSQDFAHRDEARSAERQIKGWSRAKKLALIRGDWERISMLAKGKNGPSTSSGRTGLAERARSGTEISSYPACPERVEGVSLVCHRDTPCSAIERIVVAVKRDANALMLSYTLQGNLDKIRLPEPVSPTRADRLWESTCFEAFVRPHGSDAYIEFNFDPARRWASYKFDSYRSTPENPQLPVPRIGYPKREDVFVIEPVVYLNSNCVIHLALSAVIEEIDGTKSYWAIRHPAGAPDFHHPDCFALTLGAPETP